MKALFLFAVLVAVGRAVESGEREWVEVARCPTAPEAVLVAGERVFVAGRGFLLTGEDGRWRETEPPGGAWIQDLAHGTGRLVACCADGSILYSEDGLIWRVAEAPPSAWLNAVHFDGRRFEAVGAAGTVFVSADGVVWRAGRPAEIEDDPWIAENRFADDVGYRTLGGRPGGEEESGVQPDKGFHSLSGRWTGEADAPPEARRTAPPVEGAYWVRHGDDWFVAGIDGTVWRWRTAGREWLERIGPTREMTNGWLYSEWLGVFRPEGAGRFRHPAWGVVDVAPAAEGRLLFRLPGIGELEVDPEQFPVMRRRTDGARLRYEPESRNPLLFYNLEEKRWEKFGAAEDGVR